MAYTFNVYILSFILIALSLIGCSQNRNFDGAAKPFNHLDRPVYGSGLELYPEVMFGFRPNTSGFDFSIFQRTSDGYNGRSLLFQVNTITERVSIQNVNFGRLKCHVTADAKVCSIDWLDSDKFFEFDTNKYELTFKFKKLVAVLDVNSPENITPQACVLDPNHSFIDGESLEITLSEVHPSEQSMESKRIIFYNFGTENTGEIRGADPTTVSYYFSFDFDKHFKTEAYFFDAYPVMQMNGLKLFRIGARLLDENKSKDITSFCFYDNI